MNLATLTENLMEIYQRVEAANLTPEQLRANISLDKYLGSVEVEFESSVGRRYSIKHISRQSFPFRSYVQLLSDTLKDKEDFKRVEEIVAEMVNGKLGTAYDHGDIISRVINLKTFTLTQAGISDLIDMYKQNFSNVRIISVIFYNVPIPTLKNSGVPPNKLRTYLPVKELKTI